MQMSKTNAFIESLGKTSFVASGAEDPFGFPSVPPTPETTTYEPAFGAKAAAPVVEPATNTATQNIFHLNLAGQQASNKASAPPAMSATSSATAPKPPTVGVGASAKASVPETGKKINPPGEKPIETAQSMSKEFSIEEVLMYSNATEHWKPLNYSLRLEEMMKICSMLNQLCRTLERPTLVVCYNLVAGLRDRLPKPIRHLDGSRTFPEMNPNVSTHNNELCSIHITTGSNSPLIPYGTIYSELLRAKEWSKCSFPVFLATRVVECHTLFSISFIVRRNCFCTIHYRQSTR